ncbi:hypothetical protein [Nitrosomonas nitrosa]|uniref:hypothetical protein n=1 Tax=Nitrosomonas nitrosa TaxID=52442 RepID=UPI000B818C53|nr:hypothetical protein [Nitrosomonas nitrosa]
MDLLSGCYDHNHTLPPHSLPTAEEVAIAGEMTEYCLPTCSPRQKTQHIEIVDDKCASHPPHISIMEQSAPYHATKSILTALLIQ